MTSNSTKVMAMRIRVKFAKTEPMRFTSHLDLYRAWERLLRRADMPLVFSQGFNPRPRIQLAAPLPLGITSRFEIVDFWLSTGPGDLETISSRLTHAQPPGIEVVEVILVETDSPPLQKKVYAAEYTVALLDRTPNLDHKIETLMSSEKLLRQKRGKSYDLRPLIKELTLSTVGGDISNYIFMRLNAQEGRTGRPEEVLLALDIRPENTIIERTRLLFQD
jgi:radical SAM-linked protein